VSVLRSGAAVEALVVTRGHPFDRNAFSAMLDALPDTDCTLVEHPAARLFFTPETAAAFDATVLYDMPGIEFTPRGLVFHDPPKQYVDDFLALLESGHGFVFLHHAIAGWPTWPEYAEIVGGRFLYRGADVRGRTLPDSGYRHDVNHRVTVEAPGHPVLEGLGDGFEIEDEVYLFQAFEDSVTPLLRSDFRFVDDEFFSAANAVAGRMFSRENWSHPPGSDLIGWTHRYGRSPIVTLLCGDGPKAYANPGLQRLLANAIHWVAAEARRGRNRKQGD
jgi:hypothetical protein